MGSRERERGIKRVREGTEGDRRGIKDGERWRSLGGRGWGDGGRD